MSDKIDKIYKIDKKEIQRFGLLRERRRIARNPKHR